MLSVFFSTSYILLLRPFNLYEFEGVDNFTNLPHPYSHSYPKLAKHCRFKKPNWLINSSAQKQFNGAIKNDFLPKSEQPLLSLISKTGKTLPVLKTLIVQLNQRTEKTIQQGRQEWFLQKSEQPCYVP